MTESIGKRLTVQALEMGWDSRFCECPAHIMGKCYATNMMECGCHRHIGGDCTGVVLLRVCSACGGRLLPGYVILECGCLQCERCAVDTLLSKPWAKDLDVEGLMEYLVPMGDHQESIGQRVRLKTLILLSRESA